MMRQQLGRLLAQQRRAGRRPGEVPRLPGGAVVVLGTKSRPNQSIRATARQLPKPLQSQVDSGNQRAQ